MNNNFTVYIFFIAFLATLIYTIVMFCKDILGCRLKCFFKRQKTLILLVGQTGVGKDTVANLLPYKKVCSYTTRPKRESEVNGREHIFVSNNYMKYMLEYKKDKIFAKTKIGEYSYCALLDDIKAKTNVYIVDPNGVKEIKNVIRQNMFLKNNIKLITIYLHLPFEIRYERSSVRDVKHHKEYFEKRNDAENEEFENFRCSGQYDILIYNENSETTAKIIKSIVRSF